MSLRKGCEENKKTNQVMSTQTGFDSETALFLRSSGRFVDHVCFGILGSLVSEVTPQLSHGD